MLSRHFALKFLELNFRVCGDFLLRSPERVHFFVATKKRTKESAQESSLGMIFIGFADFIRHILVPHPDGQPCGCVGVFLPLRLAHKSSAKISDGIENLSSAAGEHVSGIRIRPVGASQG